MEQHIEALKRIHEALSGLEQEEAKRVLSWAGDYYGVSVHDAKSVGSKVISEGDSDSSSLDGQFEDVGDLFDAVNPSSDPEKALAVGYWLQVVEKQDGLSAQKINNELKNMGHGSHHITDAMTSLIQRKPSLVRQVAKGGSTQQARKTYKLTRAGIDRVRNMVAGEAGDEE